MKAIEELIEIEKEYIKERTAGIDNLNFAEILQENELTPEQFQCQKAEHYMKTFNPTVIIGEVVVEKTEQNFEKDRAYAKKNSLVCGVPTGTMVWYTDINAINAKYCDENNIHYRIRTYTGGTICINPEDLEVSIIGQNAPSGFASLIISKVKDWVQSKTDHDVTISGNDILIDGEKICGMAIFAHEEMTAVGFHMSFNVDLDLIKHVCNKEMKKVPSCLAKFGTYNREELITEMITWLR